MTEATQPQQPERDPLLDKVVTLTFNIDQINGILNLIGSEVPFIKAVGLVNEIQRQVGEQLAKDEANEPQTTS
jgi:hypothetical protein